MSTLVKAERKQQKNKLEYSNKKAGIYQTNSPLTLTTQGSMWPLRASEAACREGAYGFTFCHVMACEHDRVTGYAGSGADDGGHECDLFEVRWIVRV
jgi:hypothetical protein